jgi:hypothetical protein
LENFENNIFLTNFNTNLNKIVQSNFKRFLKTFLKIFSNNVSRIFPKKQSPKGVLVVPISPLAPFSITLKEGSMVVVINEI